MGWSVDKQILGGDLFFCWIHTKNWQWETALKIVYLCSGYGSKVLPQGILLSLVVVVVGTVQAIINSVTGRLMDHFRIRCTCVCLYLCLKPELDSACVWAASFCQVRILQLIESYPKKVSALHMSMHLACEDPRVKHDWKSHALPGLWRVHKLITADRIISIYIH